MGTPAHTKTITMQSWILKFGALAALAQTISAAQVHIETTHPPANKYKSHCTVIVEGELWPGCNGGSSGPFPGGCGDNSDTDPASICGDGKVNVNWTTGMLNITSSLFDAGKSVLFGLTPIAA